VLTASEGWPVDCGACPPPSTSSSEVSTGATTAASIASHDMGDDEDVVARIYEEDSDESESGNGK
jgi:hypothetical protein